VVVRDDFYLYIPTAFTPDGDGLNDLFGPVLSRIDLAEYRFWITNRNGLVVFETNEPTRKWDGSAPGSGYYEGSGVYFWQLIARPDFNLETKVYQGKVVLVR
jgi:gliding motility-associated-like protein